MRIKIKPLSAVLLLVALISCKASLTETYETTRGKSYFSLGGLLSAGLNVDDVDAILNFGGSAVYNDLLTNNFVLSAGGQAIFTNDTTAQDVTSLSLNGLPLTKEYLGQYTASLSFYPSTFEAHWLVDDYEGADIDDLSNSLGELRFSGLNGGDSVLKSAGFTISYTGENGGDLSIDIYFDRASTSIYGDTTIANTGVGHIQKIVSDNGSFVISSAELADFTTGGYIMINIAHWEYHQLTTTTGREVGVHNRYSASIPLFLKPF